MSTGIPISTGDGAPGQAHEDGIRKLTGKILPLKNLIRRVEQKASILYNFIKKAIAAG